MVHPLSAGWITRTVFLVLLLFNSLETQGRTVEIGTGFWPPYLDQSAEGGGFLTRLIREAFATQDIQVRFIYVPWSRALAMTRSGQFDATAVWSCTPTREEEFLFSRPLYPFRYVLFHRKNDGFSWSSIKDWAGLRIGLTQDYAYGSKVATAIARGLVRPDITTSDRANFQKLLLGRIDLFPMDPLTGFAMLSETFDASTLERITFDPHPVRLAWYHLMFNRSSDEATGFREAFDTGLATLIENGRYQQLVTAMESAWLSDAITSTFKPGLAELIQQGPTLPPNEPCP
ncbi:extracellular solute-binding protein [Marinobacter santoriniensis NKSG1]|uniref:Extracellular solute-binding protein n=1 Tax=Marinobacter santoriniensis NKSG1 TaxID=1288826 RepID=M7CQU4_9GAMM|nr:transporter substrate-binding domain-containing protein [Marinobacter santoriniensis]EMP54450.1 extracellular solute-binding protein [Marinobacter santoriniensis NKSG1]